MSEEKSDKAKQKEPFGDYPNHPVQDTPFDSKKNSESDFNLDKKESQADPSMNPLQQFGMNVPINMSNDRMKDLMGQFPTNTGIPDIQTPPMGMNIPTNEQIEVWKEVKKEMEKIGPGPYSEADEEKIAEIVNKMMKKTSEMNINPKEG